MEKNCLREKVLIVYIAPILCLLTYLYLYFFQRAAAAKSLQSCPALCNSIDGSPPGSPGPWDSPGKNTGVGCHFLLQCMKVKSESELTQSCLTLCDPIDGSPPGSPGPWDSPGKNTGVGCHCCLRCFSLVPVKI